jgi:hypothetical protein
MQEQQSARSALYGLLLALSTAVALGDQCSCLGGAGYGNECAHWDAPDEKPWCRVAGQRACGEDDTFESDGHFWSHKVCGGKGKKFDPSVHPDAPLGDAPEAGASGGGRSSNILTSLKQLKPIPKGRSKFCFPAIFKGTLYKMTPLFVESMKGNRDASWILIHVGGNMGQLAAMQHSWMEWPENLQVVHVTSKELEDFTAAKMDVTFKQPLDTMQGPKMNDWKHTFGKLFEDWMPHCEFWGYTDFDVIYGNLDLAVPSALTANYDIISAKPNELMGPFTLFRNIPKINGLYKDDPNWRDVISDWTDRGAFGFMGFLMYDEQGMDRLVKAKMGSMRVIFGIQATPLGLGMECSTTVRLGQVCTWDAKTSAIQVVTDGDTKVAGLMIHPGYAKRHTEDKLTPLYLKNLVKNGLYFTRFDETSSIAEGLRIKIEPQNKHNAGKTMDTFTHMVMTNNCKHLAKFDGMWELRNKIAADQKCPAGWNAKFYDTDEKIGWHNGPACVCMPGTCLAGTAKEQKCVPRERTGDPLQDAWAGGVEGKPWSHGVVTPNRAKNKDGT